ncbi:hypothetical protein MUO71_02105 [Candidatus Bathyarchaeota archaeon]|nr:hypothetical protein [Candidatus Bathyarchaeota archaeon]
MPERTDLDPLKELKSRESDIPFILFIGKFREEIMIEALNFGANRYFNKNGKLSYRFNRKETLDKIKAV